MSDAPGWFTRAIDTTPESHRIDVGGTSIHYLAWGERDLPGIVRVHGGAAHAHWWDHIGPSFLPDYRVVALDLSGHGDSDRRAGYTLRAWTEEVAAVIDDAGFTSPPVVSRMLLGLRSRWTNPFWWTCDNALHMSTRISSHRLQRSAGFSMKRKARMVW